MLHSTPLSSSLSALTCASLGYIPVGESETRSGILRLTEKVSNLPPRIEQQYSRISGYVMGLFRQHETGTPGAARELLFVLRCLKLHESKCGSNMPEVFDLLADEGDGEVELVAVATAGGEHGSGSSGVVAIDVEQYIIDCLIVGEKKPDPARLNILAAAAAEVKSEPINGDASGVEDTGPAVQTRLAEPMRRQKYNAIQKNGANRGSPYRQKYTYPNRPPRYRSSLKAARRSAPYIRVVGRNARSDDFRTDDDDTSDGEVAPDVETSAHDL